MFFVCLDNFQVGYLKQIVVRDCIYKVIVII